jgi:hypothetical protein
MAAEQPINKTEVLERYLELHKIYAKTKKADVIKEAETLIMDHKFDEALKAMKPLAGKEELLDRLCQQLKYKPVYKSLGRLIKGRCRNVYEGVKALSSLLAHVCVELEKGNDEYKFIAEEIYKMVGKGLMEL